MRKQFKKNNWFAVAKIKFSDFKLKYNSEGAAKLQRLSLDFSFFLCWSVLKANFYYRKCHQLWKLEKRIFFFCFFEWNKLTGTMCRDLNCTMNFFWPPKVSIIKIKNRQKLLADSLAISSIRRLHRLYCVLIEIFIASVRAKVWQLHFDFFDLRWIWQKILHKIMSSIYTEDYIVTTVT